jgi:hypothetical protein
MTKRLAQAVEEAKAREETSRVTTEVAMFTAQAG